MKTQSWIQRDGAGRDLYEIQVSTFSEIPFASYNIQDIHVRCYTWSMSMNQMFAFHFALHLRRE